MNNYNICYISVALLIIILLSYFVYNFNNYNNFNNQNNCNTISKETMKCHLQKFLTNTQNDWNYILPTELAKEDLSKYFLLDIRKPEDYNNGHIPGSVNIFWKDLLLSSNIDKLPTDKQIILICYVGHTSSQALVLLKLLGYNVKVLKFGMGTSPNVNTPVAGWNNYGYPIQKN